MSSGSARVLHIDDDPALARLLQRALGRLGYIVENADSIESGIARVHKGNIDVIVLDHFLPTGTGLDFLKEASQLPDMPPVVYVTGAADTSVAVAALKAGAADYVAKTAGNEFIELLASGIRQALEKARLQREHDRAEKEVRDARDRAELMLHEVNHRVANSLALVASLVAMQARSVSEPAVRTVLGEIQGRISAIANVHRRLYTSQDVRAVEVSDYLTSLLHDLELAMKEAGHAATIRLAVKQFEVSTDKVVSLGVIVTELVTNAFKYAYPGSRDGEIRVSLQRIGPQKAELKVEDDGAGWKGDGLVQGTGFGSRIINALAKNLGSSVAYADAAKGCAVSLVFDL
jgi:two-component sensor histidine kinase